MYNTRPACPSSTRATRVIRWLLLAALVLSCPSAWAEVRLIDSFVYGGPGETPWGEIVGHFEDGTLGGGATPTPFEYYREFRRIDTSSLSNDIQYDLDRDGEVDSSAGSEVGLFYAEAYANVIALGEGYREWGAAQAQGTACFEIDTDVLSLHWDFEKGPTGNVYPQYWSVQVYDQHAVENPFNFQAYSGQSPDSGTQLLSLAPDREYVLVWSVSMGAGAGFDHSGSVRLALDLVDAGDPAGPIPAVIDVTADAITPRTKSITCSISLPDGYDVAAILPESIRLEGTVSPERSSVKRHGRILAVKFPTTELNLLPGDLVLTVTGQLANGTLFEGTDSVAVVERGRKE